MNPKSGPRRKSCRYHCYRVFICKVPVVTLALLLPMLWAQTEYDPPRSVPVYRNPDLGFRYWPPQEMHDKTDRSTASLEDQAKALHIKSKAELLLSMSSGGDDTAHDWHSLNAVAYPRDAYSSLDDASAEAKMSDWVGGTSTSTQAHMRRVVISGQSFLVSVFAMQEGPVRKGAVVWTTIRKGKLLSFAFAANDPDQLKALTETIKTIQFF